jgi:hypothetical protein
MSTGTDKAAAKAAALFFIFCCKTVHGINPS